MPGKSYCFYDTGDYDLKQKIKKPVRHDTGILIRDPAGEQSVAKARILIVEDEPIIAYDLKGVLERLDYEVVGTVATGEDAVRQAGNDRPDLILMDIVLQGPIDGIQAAFIIRRSFDIPIIYMTANADDETIHRGRETEPYAYLLKPVNIRDIYSNIDSALNRHRMERQLRDSEGRFRNLVELLPDGIYIHVDGKIVYANRVGIINAGARELEELIGKTAIDFVVPEHRISVIQRISAILARGEQAPFAEETFIRLDGSTIDVEVAALPLVYEGRPAIQVIVRDLTGRKRMEQALRDNEARFRAMFEKSNDAIVVFRNGEHFMSNPAHQAMFGYASQDEFRRISAEELLAESSRTMVRDFINRRMRGEEAPNSYEARCRRLDGTEFEADVRATTYEVSGERYTMGILRDITERKNTADVLRQSEEKYRTLIETTKTGFVIVDSTGGVLDANSEYVRMTGHQQLDAIKGHHVIEWTAGHDHERNTAAMAQCLRDGHIYGFEVEYQMPDGAITPIEINATVMGSGSDAQVMTLCRDITERRQTADSLRQSEEKFMKAFETSPFLMAISTIGEGLLIEVNQTFLTTMGYAREEVIGRTANELGVFVQPEMRDRVIAQLQETGGARDIDFLIRTRSGEVRNGSFSAVFIEIGNRPYLLTVMNDITERVRARAALERERNQFLAGPVVAFKWIAAEHWPLEYVSPNVSQFGYRAEDFASGARSFESIIHPDDRDRVQDEVRRCREQDLASYEQEFRIIDAGGTVRWVHEYTVVTRNPEGEVSHYDGYVLDTTTRKKAEEEKARLEVQLSHSQKMESIGRLAGGIAHDFNNMLTAIIGNISLALTGVGDDDPLQKTLGDAMMAADSAAALTRQLLAFSRKQIIEPKVINLNTLIDSMQHMLVRLIGEDIALKTITAADLSLVKADTLQIEQIIVNLAVNARDAMPSGGELIIETANRTIDEAFSRNRTECRIGRHVMLAISDTGTGMADEVRQHLFEPFFTTKPLGQGTGLGLAMIYGAVRQNGGFIDVESQPGVGTAFRIYLPITDEPAARPDRAINSKDLPGGSETILLVEDEAVVRDLALKVLGRLGYRVIPCAGGGEALAAARAFPKTIHLLITDVVMPGMNGRDLALQARAMMPSLRVLLSSGYVENIIANTTLDQDGFHFIPKPYTPRDLAVTVRTILDR